MDASDTFWYGIITQVPMKDIITSHEQKIHEPLAIISERLNNTNMGWYVLEKEAYEVMDTFYWMNWMVADPIGFDLHTDHNNFILLYCLNSVVMDLSQTTARMFLCWAVRLSIYN